MPGAAPAPAASVHAAAATRSRSHTCRLIAAGMARPRARGLRGRGLTLRNTFRFGADVLDRAVVAGGCAAEAVAESRPAVSFGAEGRIAAPGRFAATARRRLASACTFAEVATPVDMVFLGGAAESGPAGTFGAEVSSTPPARARLPMRRPRGGRGPVDPTGALGRISRMTDKTVADRHRRYTGAERTHPGRGARPISAPPPQKLPQRQVRVDVRQQPLELLQPLPAIVVDRRLELPSSRAERPYPVGRATKSAGPNEAR